jgi:TatD DNase family protein
VRAIAAEKHAANEEAARSVGLIDTHAHVQMRQFDRDRAAVLDRARAAGVEQMVCPGTDVRTSSDAIALAAGHPNFVFACAGVHPHDTVGFSDATLAEIRDLAQKPGIVVAVGEIGLDYYRDLAPRDDQRRAFAAQVALARALDLPIVVHNRDAHDDIMAELRPYGTVRGVWHCFIGDRAMAEEGLSLGMYLSFAGVVTYPANTTLMEVAAWAPLDRMLIETDSPYLTPHPHRRERNEPANVAVTAAHIAALRHMPVEDLNAATSANARALFGLPPA